MSKEPMTKTEMGKGNGPQESQPERRELERASQPTPSQQVKSENDPAVERGERILTGKTISRGGKEKGHVPGATEQK